MLWQQHWEKFAARLRRYDIPATVRLWNGAETALGAAPVVTITVRNPTALTSLLDPSLASLGRAYVEGDIDVDGRTADIVAVAARLAEHGPEAGTGLRRAVRMVRHTREIDADAIAYHYDVSNEFYAHWLGPQMVYSCAYFRSPEDSLETAQMQKIDHVLRKLQVRAGDRLLDIGCGWGALIARAAERFGAQALGITLSRNQYDHARERIAAAGLSGRCEVALRDYRDVGGKYDRIASIGMFEHVGLQHLRDYFARINAMLADDGTFLNHGITSTDPDSAETPWGGGEFIERYVFPHGELPHLSLALKEMCVAGLEPVDVESLRRHYALTLQHWARRFEDAGPRLGAIAGEKRYRIWRVFLAGCADGFAHHRLSLHQILAVKAGAGALPLTRDYMYA
ncbi:MAG: class I SAM-dependent methyltransferase [Betaproteobacteria bacterium]|nr:class I SAM-dependent methyltransferase [Betaproteobacteria bacterium]